MPNINDLYPSRWLKAADLQKRQVTVTIDRVDMEDIGDEGAKPVAYFVGKDKGLVLNKTNSTSIAELADDEDTDNWGGTKLVLFPTKVSFNGRTVDAIRVMPAMQNATRTAKPEPAEEPAEVAGEEPEDDNIPF